MKYSEDGYTITFKHAITKKLSGEWKLTPEGITFDENIDSDSWYYCFLITKGWFPWTKQYQYIFTKDLKKPVCPSGWKIKKRIKG